MSQLVTANRWRMIPATACTSPIPSMTAVHFTSMPVSFAATPWSIARPIIAGITAWETIHTIPKNMPSSIVCH